jgi:hypothetical protein
MGADLPLGLRICAVGDTRDDGREPEPRDARASPMSRRLDICKGGGRSRAFKPITGYSIQNGTFYLVAEDLPHFQADLGFLDKDDESITILVITAAAAIAKLHSIGTPFNRFGSWSLLGNPTTRLFKAIGYGVSSAKGDFSMQTDNRNLIDFCKAANVEVPPVATLAQKILSGHRGANSSIDHVKTPKPNQDAQNSSILSSVRGRHNCGIFAEQDDSTFSSG